MSDSLSLDVRGVFSWLRQESLALSTVADAARLEYSTNLPDGDADGQANVLWHDRLVIAPAAHQDLDLNDLVSTIFGSAVSANLATVKALLIVNTATTAGEDLLVGGAGAAGHAWCGPLDDDPDATLSVPADSVAMLLSKLNGWPVTAGSAHILRLTNNGANDVAVKIVLAGTA